MMTNYNLPIGVSSQIHMYILVSHKPWRNKITILYNSTAQWQILLQTSLWLEIEFTPFDGLGDV